MENREDNLQPEVPEWLTVYRDLAVKAHQLRQANDHTGAKQLFEEALAFIQDEKKKNPDEKKLGRLEMILHFSVLDCLIFLQSPPSSVMEGMHKYGESLKEFMIDFSRTNEKFAKVPDLFTDNFTATDILQFKNILKEFEQIISVSQNDEFSPEQNEKLGIFYLFLNKFFETAQQFFCFSTTMINEGEECKKLFRETANQTIEIFDRLDEESLNHEDIREYKNYINTWFSIYADIMDATYALYVKDHVFDSNWAFQEKDVDMLWSNIETSLGSETDHAAQNQDNQNVAAQAMELLIDVYSTEALMNIDNYENAINGLDKISEQAKKLKQPERLIFLNHLKRAIIARKYLLEMHYDEGTFLSQLNPTSFFGSRSKGSEDTQLSETQYEDTDFVGDFTFSKVDPFDVKTTQMHGNPGWASAMALPDEDDFALQSIANEFVPTRVYEQTELRRKALRKDEVYMNWEARFVQEMRKDLEMAKIYIPENIKKDNHILNKWLAIIEARILLYDYRRSKEDDDDSKSRDPQEDMSISIAGLIDDSQPSVHLARIEELILKYTETLKGTYFRQIVEIYIILGWVYIEKIELMKDALSQEEDIDIEDEPFVCFDKARHYLCKAFNILQDLGGGSEIMHNEIRRAYAKLEFIKKSKTANENEAMLPSIDAEAKKFRKGEWNKAFCNILRSENLTKIKGYKQALLIEFEKKAKQLISNITSVGIFTDNSDITSGTFFQNDVAKGGMFKTFIKVPENDSLVLGIQSELPIPNETLELLPEFVSHIFRLYKINDLRHKLETIKNEKFKNPIKKQILFNACKITQDLLPEDLVKENEHIRQNYLKKLFDAYELEHHHAIDTEDALYIAMLYDIGMAGIDSYFLNNSTELLPFERIKLEQHIEAGIEILRGILGVEEFNDILMVSMLHHQRTNEQGYPKQLDDVENPRAAKNLMMFMQNLSDAEVESIGTTEDLNDRMMFVVNMLAICDTFKGIISKRKSHGINIENADDDNKIKIFLANQALTQFPIEMVEFVERTIFPHEGVGFFWELDEK